MPVSPATQAKRDAAAARLAKAKPEKPKAISNRLVGFTLDSVQVSAKTGKPYTRNARYSEVIDGSEGQPFFGTMFFTKTAVAAADGTLPQRLVVQLTGFSK